MKEDFYKCSWCKQLKHESQFFKDNSKKNGRRSHCKICANARIRESYYPKHRDKILSRNRKYYKTELGKKALARNGKKYREKNPEKSSARQALQNAVHSGKIKRKSCQICGNPKSEAHHKDYSRPFDVDWYCHIHHREVEGRICQSYQRGELYG